MSSMLQQTSYKPGRVVRITRKAEGLALTWEPELVYVFKVLLPVLFCSQIQDASTPQAVLHSHLDGLPSKTTLVFMQVFSHFAMVKRGLMRPQAPGQKIKAYQRQIHQS
jgi:hypothetical protein